MRSDDPTVQREEYALTQCSALKHEPYLDPSGNLEVGLRLARAVAQDDQGALLAWGFGYPGAGKSSFANALGLRACAECNFKFMLEVHCLNIARQRPEDVQPVLEEIYHCALDPENGPILAFFDEIDTIARKRREYPAQRIVTEWTMGLLKQLGDSRCLFIGVTNHIDHCDPVVKSHLGPKLFFEPPTADVLEGMLRANNVAGAPEVVAAYWSLCQAKRLVPFQRNLATAMKNAARLVGSAWVEFEPQALAELLLRLSTPDSLEEYEEWQKDNADHIEAARGLKQDLRNA